MSEENKNTSEVQEEVKETQADPAGEAEASKEEAQAEPQEAQEKDTSGEASEETDGAEDKPEGKTKASFFGKKKKEKDKKDQQIEELTDRLKRSMAEFDNFRKRTEKEKASMYIIGAKEIIEKILPVADNFERGLAQAAEGDAFAEGMKMIYKQMMTTLEDLGVKPIEAVGKEFDPNFHNAVMHVEDESVGENIVVEELQKGYTYKDFVIRHSMVKVAN
ncbi:MAG TPA: nucleotide exchange factor GrpE [Candidatus Blautia faecigallinarum]|uniref:Protein GrpE n=1 Tax=Candidatus Blautia faecigallinarum TaxID=2838488 RepID=A0A9D2ITB5_9FIRM|nr:nucleotide exchange factor GrpE [Candidatus Blautia faecigallinarum]